MQALDNETANQSKAFQQTLEQAKEELRDAYMSFKDLHTRCVIDIRRGTRFQEENPVFYFKPETFLLDEPEKQRVYRQKLLSKIANVPKPPAIVYLGDELHKSMSQSVADQSSPKLTKKNLCEYFLRRQYQLQHLKYKMLCRWAHHNLTQETSENIGIQATFMYGKLEYNLEQAMQRIERLKVDDFFEQADDFQRPTTQIESAGCSLYVEKFDLKPQSLLREDDIEVYMRGVAHKSKLGKVQTKFLSRLKWLAILKKFDIYESSVQEYFKLKQQNIERQQLFIHNAKTRAQKSVTASPNQSQEIDAIFNRAYCNQYEKQFAGSNERTQNFWKPIHDDVPKLISDQYSLRQQIVETANFFGLTGDIELDQGYSFSYQVSVFLPTNLYKQILKSQFSIYDLHDHDPNHQMKRTFNQMAKFDINIFKDISTSQNTIPTEDAFQQEIKDQDIKVMRMKSAEYWLSYVILEPQEPEWHHKQQAVLTQNNPIDQLLVNGFNFIDVNDLATINRINEDNIQLHLKSVAKTLSSDHDNGIEKVSVATADGDQIIDVHRTSNKTSHIGLIEEHLLAAVSEQQPSTHQFSKVSVDLPGHLLTTYFTLRFLQSKDAKTRLLYTLNYFRAIQRRLALDLREFATRDRINSQFANPFVPSQESNQITINKINQSVNAFEKVQRNAAIPELKISTKMTVFNDEQISRIKNMASLRQYKLNGSFNNLVLSTCPAYPRFHVANGEPLIRMEDNLNVMGKALKLMGRVQMIELNEQLREVYIKDDFGIYIIYDCVLQDMKYMEQEMAKICSHYLHKSEMLLDPTDLLNGQRPFPIKDRLEILKDILVFEAEFNFKKVLLCQVYMECYEHVSDPLDQQKLMQVITDIMARRPRLNLEANYFTDSYNAELECLDKQFELVKTMVDLQISVEVTENRRLQESISLSYKMADEYAVNKWKYQDAETLLQSVVGSKADPKVEPQQQQVAHEKHKSRGLWQEDTSSVSDDQCYQEEKDKFSRLLGLEQISLESIYLSYQQKDINILKIMSEHSNFMQCYEGYPEFLQYTHKQLSKPQFYNPWSQPMGALDFYDTLDFIIKFQQVTVTLQEELHSTLTPWDSTLATIIDTQIAIQSLDEFRRVLQIQEGVLLDYKGREVIEDESILGNADRMIFYAKELVADLSYQPKALLDPFIVSKLDLETIKYFDFPQLPIDLNKYTQRSNGIQGFDFLLHVEKTTMEGIAKNKFAQGEMEKVLQGKVSDTMNLRNVIVPSMLHLYCNMVEMQRVRAELIIATAETSILSEIYLAQVSIVGQKQQKLVQSEGISFQLQDQKKFVNYVDDGPSHMLEIDLALREFDPTLLSNLNFRNADSFKLCILASGLEELRAALQYQILQKHLLIVATRMNQLVIDIHQKAYSELNLFQQKIVVPNSIVNYAKLFNRNQDSINFSMIKSERSQFKLSLSSNCSPVFYNIITKKQTQRAQISKEFLQYHTQVIKKYPLHEQIVLRIMRSFKLKLLTRLVQSILTEVYLDAQKIQAVQTCQHLRVFNRLFAFDSKLAFKCETSPLLENYTVNYLPADSGDTSKLKDSKKHEEIKVLDKDKIVCFMGIPSSVSLLTLESVSVQELRKFKQHIKNLKSDSTFELDLQQDLEQGIKDMLPTYTVDESGLEYKEAMNCGDSSYAKLVNYYLLLDRILQQEWFSHKLKLSQQEQIEIEQCIKAGLKYWERDAFDERKQQVTLDKPKFQNQMTQQYLHAQVEALKQKQNIKQVMVNLSLTMHSFIQQHEKNKDYLPQYYEFKFQTIVGALYKLANSFMINNNLTAANICRQGIKDFCSIQHYKVNFLQPNNYSVYSCLLSTALEPCNLTFGRQLPEEIANFKRCVQPVVNEQALEPSQITLFQSLYQQDLHKKHNLFAGQYQSAQMHCLNQVLIGLSSEDRVFAYSFVGLAKNQANDFMETIFNDSAIAKLSLEEAYNMDQLQDAKKFLNEQTQALLLRNALCCWVENKPLPTTLAEFQKFEANFKQRFFWKQMMQKKELQKKQALEKVPSQSELHKLRIRIEVLANDHTLATEQERNKRDELVRALKEEFFMLKKKVTLDSYYDLKAQIQVFSNEIEKLIIQASVSALTAECTALSKCFVMQVPQIQYHIHPFQQFAATIFDQVDPNLHLDIFNKISNVQVMLTKLRNRATEVETLTSGPGMVFTVKDFNDIFNEFCRSTIKQQEEQFKARTDTMHQMQESYRELLYTKDMQIKTLKSRIDAVSSNLESIIEARMFEKGNQLIYELDSSKRVLSLFKSQFVQLEKHLVSRILGEQLQKFQRQAITNDINRVKFGQYKEAIQSMINNDWEQNAAEIKVMLKAKADQAKRTDNDVKRVTVYKAQEGAVLPEGFKHYPNCSCYVPDPNHPKPTLELAEMEMLSEKEAREELCKMCDLLRKQRLLYKTKEMLIRSKYQDEVNLLKKQLNSNKSLWDQLAESQKREKVISQELLYTQQQLSNSEKTIITLRDEIKHIDMEKARLLNFKNTQYERLKELEIKVQKSDMNEKLDTDKMIQKLIEANEQNENLKSQVATIQEQSNLIDSKNQAQVGKLQKLYKQEMSSKVEMATKIEQMKLEIKMLETTQNDALLLHWKQKCLEVLDVCQSLKSENDSLRSKCADLIQKGISLAESVQRSESRQQSTKVSDKPMYSTTTSIKQHLNSSLRIPMLNPVVKAPSTQNGVRQEYVKNDIRNVLNTVPKRLQSMDQPPSQQIKQRKYMLDQYGLTQKSMRFDVKGITIPSPRSKMLQSRKQARHLVEDSIIM